jgi:hypothetical protein
MPNLRGERLGRIENQCYKNMKGIYNTDKLEDCEVVLLEYDGTVIPGYKFNGNWYLWENKGDKDMLLSKPVEGWKRFPRYQKRPDARVLKSRRLTDVYGEYKPGFGTKTSDL